MKKKLLSIIIMSSVTISYANSYFAFIYNKPTTKYETTEPMVGGELPPLPDGEEGEGIVTNPIKSLKCIWNACIGSYETGQMFYIDGRNAPTVFQEISGFNNTTRAFGDGGTLFAENNGTLYGMLDNSHGQLGVNDLATEISSLKEVVGLKGSLIYVKEGLYTTVVQTTQGLYFAGNNDIESGIGSLFDKSMDKDGKTYTFKEAVLSTTIDDFDFKNAGFVYSDSGKLFVLGINVSGRFGLGDSAPSIITDYTEVPGLSNVKDVYIGGMGRNGQVAILKDGTIWVSGSKLDKIGLSTGLTSSTTFVDTGFAVNELNMFSRSSTTYLIKNNKLYYSGTDPVSNTTSSDFKLLQSASYFDVKSFINSSGELAMLTTDGRILSLLFDGGYYFDYIDSPNFSS